MNDYLKNTLTKLNVDNHSSLVSLFEQTCTQNRQELAFSCLGQQVSFDYIDKMSERFASYLKHQCKLNKGDRIAIQLPNLIQYPIAVWGALRVGLIVVNTNPQYTAREQIHQFNDSGSVALVVLDKLLAVTKTVVTSTNIKTIIVTSVTDLQGDDNLLDQLPEDYVAFSDALKAGSDLILPEVELSMDDVAVLQYTGGTTGPSKGAILSHGNLFCGVTMSRLSIKDDDAREIPIAPLPLYHVFGFTSCLMGVFLRGGMSVLIPNPRDLGSIISAMKTHPFTGMAGVNTLLQGLLAHPEFDDVDFSHLTRVVAGGTALVKEIADEWYRRTGTRVMEGYGLSETSAVATCNRPDDIEIGTVGPAMEYVQIKIIDSNGITLAAGRAGEVCIRGPQVMLGYWNNPEATARELDEQAWFRTGDLGILQDNGHLKIIDRIKDMIIVSGFNVYPNEIEEVVYGHPNVIECAAIGVPDVDCGEAIKLFVVANDSNLIAEQIISFCRKELTAYKVPKQIVFADDLPKSPAGKILRRELRKPS